MKDDPNNAGLPVTESDDVPALPATVDRATWQAELDALRDGLQLRAHGPHRVRAPGAV